MVIPRVAPGSRIGGYEVVSRLGEGGMGAVFAARDAAGRSVALKVLLPELLPDAGVRARFVREAEAAAKIAHENVVRVHSAGEQSGFPFIVFELVPGGSLAAALKKRERFPWREAAALGAAIARGLAAIHAAGFVHRDLKPENILLDEEGRPKVSDLGLVHAVDEQARRLTRTGDVVGTLAYMAPEQADGRSVDARADLYALGATLHALLTGRPPFEGQGAALMKRVLTDSPPATADLVPDVPDALDALVAALLEKRPGKRPPRAERVAVLLDAIARGPGSRRRHRRKPIAIVALVALVALGVAGVAVAARTQSKTQTAGADTDATDPGLEEAEAAAALHLNDVPAAVRHAERALHRDPRLAKAWAHLAIARMRLHDPQGALAAVTNALSNDPKLAEALAARAALRVDDRSIADGLADAEAALALDRNNALAHAVRGEAIFWRDRWIDVARAKEAARKEGAIAHNLDANLGRAWRVLALAPWHDRKTEDIAPCVKAGQALEPQDAWFAFFEGEVTFHPPAGSRLSLDAIPTACLSLARAIELDPRPASFWSELAAVLVWEKRPKEAIDPATRAIERDPLDPSGWVCRSLARNDLGDTAGAIEDARSVLRVSPEHPWGTWLLGHGLIRIGKDDEGIEILKSVMNRDPHWIGPAAELTEALIRTKRLDELEVVGAVIDDFLAREKEQSPDQVETAREMRARIDEALRKR